MRKLIALVAGLLLLACPAVASAAPLQSGTISRIAFQVPSWLPAKVTLAIGSQVDSAVRRDWGTPAIRFSNTTGVPVTFVPRSDMQADCQAAHALGCHYETAAGTLGIYVSYGSRAEESATLDHEVIETLIDPWVGTDPTTFDDGKLLEEVCDPDEGYDYTQDGVWLSNFVKPSFYLTRAAMVDAISAHTNQSLPRWRSSS